MPCANGIWSVGRRNRNEDFEMSADDRNCTGRFGVDAFCLALHGADLHIRSGAWSTKHGNCSACVAVLITYSPQNGVILLVMAFLISTMGLPLAEIWLLGKVQSLKFAIQDWMYG